ncbi:hypothetical protein KVD64_02840 [Helicobacter pylori]|nr:hypothetical protein KVD64_02840 [Helicobacter pylori]
MVFIILSKSIGVGAIAGYIQAFSSTEQQLQDLSFYGKWFFAINKYFENYFCILDYKTPKPETQIKLEEKIHSITFENIGFSYPNSKLNSKIFLFMLGIALMIIFLCKTISLKSN